MTEGALRSINISLGGVPKTPRDTGDVLIGGIVGDGHRDLRHHGGPERAVCLFSFDLIEALRTEGHPISVGSIGENFTVGGLDWGLLGPAARIEVGDVVLEVTRPATPCKNIAASFVGGNIARVSHKLHPGWSRWYTRVLREGRVSKGSVVLVQPAG